MIRRGAVLLVLLMTVGVFHAVGWTAGASLQEGVTRVWVQVIPPRVGLVRALTHEAACPNVRFDSSVVPMAERAAPNGDFDIRVCEAMVPEGTLDIEVAGRRLQPPPARPQRIVVLADTGCRIKAGDSPDDGFQACNDPAAWPFARIAEQVAAWGPDLIIHVGDYVYRERPCPAGNVGCANNPYNSPGLRLETWEADFFTPAKPLLEAAPIVFVRGNHEKCERAGRGYFRFLAPFPLRPCEDFTDPYALDFEGVRFVVMDTAQSEDDELSPDVVVQRFRQVFREVAQLASGRTWLLVHQPIWGVLATNEDGSEVVSVNATLQEALQIPLPAAIDLVISGHIHAAQVLNFTGNRPASMIFGIGGTKLLPDISKPLAGMVIDGETITQATAVSAHGYTTFEPVGLLNAWEATFRGVDGEPLFACRVEGKNADCNAD